MTTPRIKRKLAAVLYTDVTGYSCLMGQDEVGTLRTLNAYRDVLYGMVQLQAGPWRRWIRQPSFSGSARHSL